MQCTQEWKLASRRCGPAETGSASLQENNYDSRDFAVADVGILNLSVFFRGAGGATGERRKKAATTTQPTAFPSSLCAAAFAAICDTLCYLDISLRYICEYV